jgi:biotin carboxyl carrier protein
MKRLFRLGANGTEKEVSVEIRGDEALVSVGGRTQRLELFSQSDGTTLALFENGRVIRGRVSPGKRETRIRTRGREVALPLYDPREEIASGASSAAASEVVAVMPGRVVEVKVREGDRVLPGDLLLVLEAMKMQNEIRAEAEGIVRAVQCEAGQPVEAGAPLIQF